MTLSDHLSEAPLCFSCPRCGAESSEHWYGPCSACRAELRSRLRGTATVVVVEAYEPKMNVTPDAVALKE